MRLLLLCLAIVTTAGLAQADVPRATITFEQPVYVNMPVWVHVALPGTPELARAQANLRYPFQEQPQEFHGHDFRVTRDGEALPVIEARRASAGGGGSVAPPTSPTGRLPLHLLYRFDRPGKYLVKYEYHGLGARRASVPPLAESEWTELEVQPFSPDQRDAWLTEALSHPPQDLGLFVGDYLPSLLSLPDDRVLAVLLDGLYRPEGLVQYMALYSLSYYPDAVLRTALPTALRRRGPTVPLAYFIAWNHTMLHPAGAEIVGAVTPYLSSSEPKAAAGALQTLTFMAGSAWGLEAATRGRAVESVWSAVDHLRSLRESDVLQALVLFVAENPGKRSRDLIWEIAARPDAPGAREQALIAVSWLKDPRDLPKLGKLLLTDDPAARAVPYQMHRAWGDRALPYLTKGLRSPNVHTRGECARELVAAERPEGYAYLLQVMKGDDQQARSGVVQFLCDRGLLTSGATDADAVAALEAKLRQGRR